MWLVNFRRSGFHLFLVSALVYFAWPFPGSQGPLHKTVGKAVYAAGSTPIAKWEALGLLNSPRRIPAQVRKLLKGEVKTPGFMVPLDGDEHGFNTFLLVPSAGQCVHVPPPPPNNIIFCRSPKKIQYTGDPVWIYGRLKVENTDSQLASAYYRLDVSKTEEYQYTDEGY